MLPGTQLQDPPKAVAPAAAPRASRALAALVALGYLGLALHLAAGGLGELQRDLAFALFAAGLALALAALFAPARVRARLLTLLLSTSVALGGAELFLARHGEDAPVRLPAGYDRRSKREVLLDMRAQGFDVWPSVPCNPARAVPRPNGVPTLPLASLSRTMSLHDNDNETGEYKVYLTDRYGFNNPDEVWTLAPLELALVGDSFTFGASVLGARCFADRIRAARPKTVNLGIAGMGPLRELAVVREYLPYLRPRIVLWFWYEGNDVEGLEESMANELLPRYLEPDFRQDLVLRQPLVDRLLRGRVERLLEQTPEDERTRAERNDARLALGRRLALEALTAGLCDALRPREVLAADPPPFPAELLRRIFGLAREEIAAWGGELIVVYLPGFPALERGAPEPGRAPLLELLRELELACIDLDPVFRAHPDPLSLFPFRRFGHYDAEGNALVAREVLAALDGRL